jgi:hypothetical protein
MTPSDYLIDILEDENGFLPNMIHQLIILMLLLIVNTIFYYLIRYGEGGIKDIKGFLDKL